MEPSSPPQTLSRKTLLFIQATAFLGGLGYGVAGPVVPFMVARFVSDPGQLAVTVGWLASSFALCAFLAGPALGALSDRLGRRPILLVSLLGSAVGYTIFGFAGALPMLFLGRIVDGLTAGNISALFGYLSDSTPPEERGKYFGLVGASVGAGFIVGPAVGGLLARVSLEAPFLVAAGVTLLNLLWGYFFLPESLKPENRAEEFRPSQLNPLSQIGGLLSVGPIRQLLVVGMLLWAAFVTMQTTLAVLAKDILRWDASTTGFAFILVGLTDMLVQGVLLGPLLKRFGDRRVATVGLISVVVGLAGMASLTLLPYTPLLLITLVLFAGGEGMFTATLGGLLSQRAGAAQGQVQGGSQALQSLTNVVVPPLATRLYAGVGPSAPYWAAVGAVVLAALVLNVGSSSPKTAESSS